MSILADSYMKLGCWQNAIELHEKTVGMSRKALRGTHQNTLCSTNCFIKCYSEGGRHTEAFEQTKKTSLG
jgi:hypothetical protein